MRAAVTEEEAKEAILARVGAELSMWASAYGRMKEAVKEVCAISVRYGISPKSFRFSADRNLERDVDKVLSGMVSAILSDMEEYAESLEAESPGGGFVPYLHGEDHGSTFEERLSTYKERFKYELEVAIAAGLLLGKGAQSITSSILSGMMSPYGNPDFRKALGKGLAAARLAARGSGFGKGQIPSAANSMSLLVKTAVGAMWMHGMYRSALDGGMHGFVSFPGSSSPCGHCASLAGKAQPMEDFPGLYHPRCKCYFLFF